VNFLGNFAGWGWLVGRWEWLIWQFVLRIDDYKRVVNFLRKKEKCTTSEHPGYAYDTYL